MIAGSIVLVGFGLDGLSEARRPTLWCRLRKSGNRDATDFRASALTNASFDVCRLSTPTVTLTAARRRGVLRGHRVASAAFAKPRLVIRAA